MTRLEDDASPAEVLGTEHNISRSNAGSRRNGSKQERGVIVGTISGKVAKTLLLSIDDLGAFLAKRLEEGKQIIACALFF